MRTRTPKNTPAYLPDLMTLMAGMRPAKVAKPALELSEQDIAQLVVPDDIRAYLDEIGGERARLSETLRQSDGGRNVRSRGLQTMRRQRTNALRITALLRTRLEQLGVQEVSNA